MDKSCKLMNTEVQINNQIDAYKKNEIQINRKDKQRDLLMGKVTD